MSSSPLNLLEEVMPTPQTSVRPGSKAADPYWEKFEQLQENVSGREPSWLSAVRKAAISRFAEMGFPTLKDEDWRFTNVAPITKLGFNPVGHPMPHALGHEELAPFALSRLPGSKLVFINGQFAPELSTLLPVEKGIEITSLANALRHDRGLIEKHLTTKPHDAPNPFAALNTAFFTDGAFIHLPAGKLLEEPVQLLHIAVDGLPGTTVHPRHVIIAGSDSRLTVIENYVSVGTHPYFTNAATQLVVGDGARVEFCKLQNEALNAYHIAALHAHLERNCNVIAHSFALGARLSRNNLRTTLAGEGVECVLNGLYLTKDDQLADHHMIVEHAKPHCNSHEYFNGILDGHSRGVFHGRILVRPDAQKTDAKQTNKNLLLSDDAGVDSKPQLEIYADDVKCTHGATIGQLNEESIFYLRARGIGQETARRMLMHAFAGEIIERIRSEPVREELDKIVWDRLEQHHQIAVASQRGQ
jgi:Fe-S cluster assembly protein SufD